MNAATEDRALARMLLRLGRRFVLPALLSIAAVDAIGLVLVALPAHEWDVAGADFASLALVGLLAAAPPVVVGLLLFGLPAGLLVARLGHDFTKSLGLLVLLGAVGGAAIPLLHLHRVEFPLVIFALFSLCGAVTAGIWSALNRDLFRQHNGA